MKACLLLATIGQTEVRIFPYIMLSLTTCLSLYVAVCICLSALIYVSFLFLLSSILHFVASSSLYISLSLVISVCLPFVNYYFSLHAIFCLFSSFSIIISLVLYLSSFPSLFIITRLGLLVTLLEMAFGGNTHTQIVT